MYLMTFIPLAETNNEININLHKNTSQLNLNLNITIFKYNYIIKFKFKYNYIIFCLGIYLDVKCFFLFNVLNFIPGGALKSEQIFI